MATVPVPHEATLHLQPVDNIGVSRETTLYARTREQTSCNAWTHRPGHLGLGRRKRSIPTETIVPNPTNIILSSMILYYQYK